MGNSLPQGRGTEHKTRILEVERILRLQTNERRRLSMWEIVDALGLPRTANNSRNVLNDLRVLREYGRPISYERHKTREYYWAGRR